MTLENEVKSNERFNENGAFTSLSPYHRYCIHHIRTKVAEQFLHKWRLRLTCECLSRTGARNSKARESARNALIKKCIWRYGHIDQTG